MNTIRVANGAGFLGDNIDAPRLLVERAEVDYLTLEYLAELTLSILARAREKDPQSGYAADFLDVLRSLCPALYLQTQLRIVTNAGGMHPRACAVAAGKILDHNGSGDLAIGVVTGDDLLDSMEELMLADCRLENLDTGQPLTELARPIVSANAYLGAAPIVAALASDARLVITGRVADASLTVGPAVYEFGWTWKQWDQLAAASVAGHLIECGAQVTGGYSHDWQHLNLADVGYPIAELQSSGESTITKPPGTGGAVTRDTVVQQLLYEIGDPAHYLTPDVDVDFTSVELTDQGHDRVLVQGAVGSPATDTYKVSLAYRAGYTTSGQLLFYGPDCVAKAQAAAEMIEARVKRGGYQFARMHAELLGTGASLPGMHAPPTDLREVVLRLSVQDPRREAVERFSKEFAPLVTSGPAGIAGYAVSRPAVRPVLAYWPTLVPKELVAANVEIHSAHEWAESE